MPGAGQRLFPRESQWMVNVGWGCSHAAGMDASDPDAHCIPRSRAWRGWTSSGITLRPGVLLHRNSRGTFVRATGPVRPLLGELEEFCATSLKTLLLLLKHCALGRLLPTSPLRLGTAAGATLAGEQEQPSLSSLQQGRCDSPPSLQVHCQNRVFCWKGSPPCLDFLIHSGLVHSPSARKTSLMAGASHRGQNRMLGGL